MQPHTTLVWMLYDALPEGIPSPEQTQVQVQGIEALLSLLSDNPALKLTFYLSSPTISRLAGPAQLPVWRTLAAEGRVELLAGGLFAPLLPSIPEVDASFQLGVTQARIKALTGQDATGVWLSGGAFDPSLIPLLGRHGLHYSLLETAQLTATLPLQTQDGGPARPRIGGNVPAAQGGNAVDTGVPLWVTERLAHRLHLWGMDSALTRALFAADTAALPALLMPEAQRLDRVWVLPIALETLLTDPTGFPRLQELIQLVHDRRDRLSFGLPGALASRCAPQGLVWPGSSIPPELVERIFRKSTGTTDLVSSLGQPVDGRSGPLPSQKESARKSSRNKKLSPEPALVYSFAVPWEVALARSPETNRLHKTMLRLSGRLQRATRLIEEQRISDPKLDESLAPQLALLDRSRQLLFQAQTQAPWWPDVRQGPDRVALRHATRLRLVELQSILDRFFHLDSRWVALERLDLDRDGREDIRVSTPGFEGMIASTGGVLYDLVSKSPARVISDLPMRRREAFHDPLLRSGLVMVKKKGNGASETEPGTGDASAESPSKLPVVQDPNAALSLAKSLRQDRYLRGCFIDHLLGAGATVDNFYACQYPEAGEFLHSPYEIITLHYQQEVGVGRVQLARNSTVLQPDRVGEALSLAERPSVRLEKHYRFLDGGDRIEVNFTLINRGHSPVSVTFGTELGFSLPWMPRTRLRGGSRNPVSFVREPTGELARGSDDYVQQVRLEQEGGATEAILELELSDPARLWWFPHSLVLPDPQWQAPMAGAMAAGGPGGALQQGLALEPQGCVLLPHWRISLWNQEQRSITVILQLRA